MPARTLFAIAVAFRASVLLAQPAPTTRPLTRCELFEDLESRDAQRVTIRAAYHFDRELSGLYSAPCKPAARLDGREILPPAFLRIPSQAKGTADFDLFRQAVERAKGGEPIAIILTVTGRLSTVSQAEPYTGNDGRPHEVRMFGHLGVYPVEVVVETSPVESAK